MEPPRRPPAPERRPWFKHPLVRRAPLLLVAAVGVWLFRSAGTERTLIWMLPQERAELVSFEVQLMDGDGTLVKRETFFFDRGKAPIEVRQEAKLRDGVYQARLFFGLGEGRATKAVGRSVTVDGQTIWVNLSALTIGAASFR